MTVRVVVRNNEYHDSMVLMQISHKVAEAPGVSGVAILMATDNNKPFLAYCGFFDPGIDTAGPSDLIIGIQAASDAAIDDTLAMIDRLLKEVIRRPKRGRRFASLDGACDGLPGANMAVISVPGQFAAREARKALTRGLHVFLFSDNVPVEEEISLKRMAFERRRLLMGPDCGTAIIGGIGLGFANAVQAGPVGIVAASGTGMQEVCCLLDRLGGVGISQAIGTGGRDLSDAVDGMGTLLAFDFLQGDSATEVVVVVSKPPSDRVASRVIRRLQNIGKPAVVCFLGSREGVTREGRIAFAGNLEMAALETLHLLGGPGINASAVEGAVEALARDSSAGLSAEQRFVRGVFSGGSFCYEALAYLRDRLPVLHSNVSIAGVSKLADSRVSVENALVDLGDDEFTRGRVHPMIDPISVAERVKQEARDGTVAVIIFDVVLGYGSHPDPASLLAPAVADIKRTAANAGRDIILATHVCGTERDPQKRGPQEQQFAAAGALVLPSNYQVARLAAAVTASRPGSGLAQ
jgi:succinyl-CoA synthetase alpha subunit